MIIGGVGKLISHSQKWNVYFPAVYNNGKAAYTDIQNTQTNPLCVNLKLVKQVCFMKFFSVNTSVSWDELKANILEWFNLIPLVIKMVRVDDLFSLILLSVFPTFFPTCSKLPPPRKHITGLRCFFKVFSHSYNFKTWWSCIRTSLYSIKQIVMICYYSCPLCYSLWISMVYSYITSRSCSQFCFGFVCLYSCSVLPGLFWRCVLCGTTFPALYYFNHFNVLYFSRVCLPSHMCALVFFLFFYVFLILDCFVLLNYFESLPVCCLPLFLFPNSAG